MKILVLTMTCGQGHNAIADSIKRGLQENNEVEVFDIMGKSEKISLQEHKAYMRCIKYIPHLYDIGWNLIRNKNPEKRYSGLNVSYMKRMYDYLLNKLNQFQPEAVVCTHNFASNICCIYKKNGEYNGKIYSVLFDYCCCPYWETSVLCDAIFTPHQLCHKELIERGFDENQLLPFGFPVNAKFEKEYDKMALREKLGFNSNDFVVTSMSGGFGQGNSYKLCKILAKTQIESLKANIICGKNEKQREKIQKYLDKNHITNIKVFGFINNPEEFMSASDFMITRGSGNNLTEIFQIGTVPIIRENMIANEGINKQLFVKQNMAFGMKKISDVEKILHFAKKNPEDVAAKQENIKNFVKKDAIKNICTYILKNN